MTTTTNKKTVEPNPLLLSQDQRSRSIEDYFTKAPEKTLWTTTILDNLKGASSEYAQDYLNKIDPVDERQLKTIFPNASPTQMEDPLNTVTKTRLHDNIRRDPSTQRAMFFNVFFLLGKEITPTFEVNRKFATPERRDRELQAIQNNEQYLSILEDVMNRDDEVKLQVRLAELAFSAEGFGRSVQLIKRNKKGFPCKLIPLSSTRLGRVWVDRKTWDFLGVEYLDYTREQRILLAQDILHYEVNDFHISPNSRYFGMPSIESTMAIAERNRAANELAIPEIMKRMFAPIMLVKTATKSQSKLAEIRDAWQAGKTLFINDEVEAEAIPIQHDLDKIVNAVLEGSKDIYRGLTVPQTVAFQDLTNRATAEAQMIQWYESVLEYKRNMLNAMLWEQWYKPQLTKIFEEQDMLRAASDGGSVLQYLETRAKTITDIEDRGEEFSQPIPFKIKLEFTNVRTTGFLDTSAALVQFGDRGYLEPYMVREEAGLGRWNNDMKEVEIKNALFMKKQFGMQQSVFDENGNEIQQPAAEGQGENNPMNPMNQQNPMMKQQQQKMMQAQGQNNKPFGQNSNPPANKPKGKGNFGGKSKRLPTRSSSE